MKNRRTEGFASVLDGRDIYVEFLRVTTIDRDGEVDDDEAEDVVVTYEEDGNPPMDKPYPPSVNEAIDTYLENTPPTPEYDGPDRDYDYRD